MKTQQPQTMKMNIQIITKAVTSLVQRSAAKRHMSGALLAGFFFALAATLPSNATAATLLVANGGSGAGRVGSYDSDTGVAENASLISSLNNPYDVAASADRIYVAILSGKEVGVYDLAGTQLDTISIADRPISLALWNNNLYVGSLDNTRVDLYNATTGALIQAGFVTGLGATARNLAVNENGDLYVAANGKVGIYNGTTGAAINSSFITLSGVLAMTLSGNNLYLSDFTTGNSVRLYDATTGMINGGFTTITNVTSIGLAVDENSLFVNNTLDGKVREYNATTGALINGNFITGLTANYGLAIVPEPSTLAMLGLGLFAVLFLARRRSA